MATEGEKGLELHIVDVFTDRRFTGNQLAVVLGAENLSDTQMQDIAREMNFSETTFVTRVSGDTADVRIFTPAWELPFAGHPTLGTAWVLAGDSKTFSLNLPVGTVPVEFNDGLGWLESPPVMLADGLSNEDAARLVGLDPADLDSEHPVRCAEVGPKFVLIGLRSLDALRRAQLNSGLHAEWRDAGRSVQCVFLFTAEAYERGADFASRMYFESAGVREDPATGSANCAFARYLQDLQGNIGRVVVDQGVEMQRASRLYLQVDDPLRVGGGVVRTVKGQLLVG